MKYKILAIEWRSALHTVGFVAYDTGFDDEWNSVVGYQHSEIYIPREEEVIQYIAANGAKIEWQIAQILFPQLDITKHKYYTGKSNEKTD